MRITPLIATALLALALPSGAGAGEPLPLKLVVDLDRVESIEHYSGTRATLEQDLAGVMQAWIEERLAWDWSIGGADAAHAMRLIVEIDSFDYPPLFTIELKGNIERRIDGEGRAPVVAPSTGAAFAEALGMAVKRFLREKGADVKAGSHEVHDAASLGIHTEVALDRRLGEADASRYLPNEIWVKWSGHPDGNAYRRSDAGPFNVPVYLPPGTARSADVRPKPYQPVVLPTDLVARLCIHRAQIPDIAATPVVSYDCPLVGDCAMQGASPPDWADDEDCIGGGPGGQGSLWDAIFGTARADTGAAAWYVPSLDTLSRRLRAPGTRLVGFSEFEISAPSLAGLDADSYTVALEANGVPVRIGGLPPEDDVRWLDLRDGLLLRFGIENLQFAGRADGCEALSVTLRFLKDGKPTGDELELRRGYAALRHAPAVEYETAYGQFTWTGGYRSPPGRNENGIFLSGDWYALGNEHKRRQLVSRLNRARERLDGFGWSIRAGELGLGLGLESVLSPETPLRIVGKIRPPRTIRDGSASYGLLVGVEEPNRQLQFTFSPAQVKALTGRLRALRRETPGAGGIVPDKFSIYRYTKERQSTPDWVCRSN